MERSWCGTVVWEAAHQRLSGLQHFVGRQLLDSGKCEAWMNKTLKKGTGSWFEEAHSTRDVCTHVLW